MNALIDALFTTGIQRSLWPISRPIPDKEGGVVQLQIANPLGYTSVGNLSVKPIPVHHRISTTGFCDKGSHTTVMLTSDTGMTEAVLAGSKTGSPVAFIIAHVAFPGRLSHLALRAGHMTLAMLLDRIDTYGLHHIPFYISYEIHVRT